MKELSNVTNMVKNGALGHNKGVNASEMVYPSGRISSFQGVSTVSPRDVATLVLCYFLRLCALEEQGLTPDSDWLVLDDDASDTPVSSSGSDIPGQRPIGYASGRSLVREVSFEGIRQALSILQVEDAEAYATLTQELGSPHYGVTVTREWEAAKRAYRRGADLTAAVASLEREIKALKREIGANPTETRKNASRRKTMAARERSLQKLRWEHESLVSRAGETAAVTVRVLEAAEKLIPFIAWST